MIWCPARATCNYRFWQVNALSETTTMKNNFTNPSTSACIEGEVAVETPVSTDQPINEVSRLRAAVEKALARGFSILACVVQGKHPHPKYAPRGVNSAVSARDTYGRDPLRAWDENFPANLGVACGHSGIVCIDIDQGLKDIDDLRDFMQRTGLPDTYIVRSG